MVHKGQAPGNRGLFFPRDRHQYPEIMKPLATSKARAFSLVEILIVIAVLAVLATLVLPQIMNIRGSAHLSTARQQQVELQTALGNWIVAQSSGAGGLAAAKSAYTGNKLALLQNYLQSATYAALTGSGDDVTSAALNAANAKLQFSSWPTGTGQPSVLWVNK